MSQPPTNPTFVIIQDPPSRFPEARDFNPTQLPHAAPWPIRDGGVPAPSPVDPTLHRVATRQFSKFDFLGFLNNVGNGWRSTLAGGYAAWPIDGPG
jgi:hypothetical protein